MNTDTANWFRMKPGRRARAGNRAIRWKRDALNLDGLPYKVSGKVTCHGNNIGMGTPMLLAFVFKSLLHGCCLSPAPSQLCAYCLCYARGQTRLSLQPLNL